MTSRWWIGGDPSMGGATPVFCFAYAGGSASVYHGWNRLEPRRGTNFCGFEYPGRGVRYPERTRTRIEDLVDDAATRIANLTPERYALFGHSMGGLVAFETGRELARRGVAEPTHMFISASGSPGSRSERPRLATASDREVEQELIALGGTDPRILSDPELRRYAISTIRADYSVLEGYSYQPGELLGCPLTTFGSHGDALVSPEQMRAWEDVTMGQVTHTLVQGDHFFVHSPAATRVHTVNDSLRAAVYGAGRA